MYTQTRSAAHCAGRTPPTGQLAADLARHNSPSEYSFRSTAAGHAQLMRDQLGTGPGKLPEDFWTWHLQRAGRSQASNAHKTYFDNYTGAFGSSLPYMRSAGLGPAGRHVPGEHDFMVRGRCSGAGGCFRSAGIASCVVGFLLPCCLCATATATPPACHASCMFWQPAVLADTAFFAPPAPPACRLCRRPLAANQHLASELSAAEKSALAAAVEQFELFAANPTTKSLYQKLISSVQ